MTISRELAVQLLGVAKSLSRHARFSSVGVLGGSSIAAQAKRLNQPVDLVVATPGRSCSSPALSSMSSLYPQPLSPSHLSSTLIARSILYVLPLPSTLKPQPFILNPHRALCPLPLPAILYPLPSTRFPLPSTSTLFP